MKYICLPDYLKLCVRDPENCKLKIGNEILERIGTDCTNKYFRFVGLKIDEFLNWDYQIEHVSNKIAEANSVIILVSSYALVLIIS